MASSHQNTHILYKNTLTQTTGMVQESAWADDNNGEEIPCRYEIRNFPTILSQVSNCWYNNIHAILHGSFICPFLYLAQTNRQFNLSFNLLLSITANYYRFLSIILDC